MQEMIGHSGTFLALLAEADKIAASEARVLINGETGTGKELVARRLHAESRRAAGPFVALNCAALPEALLESELFGHVRGAFTEAHRTHEGLVAAAQGGVLFLDEVAEMSLPLQAKLLRFLETGEYRKLGATETERADVRVFSATHRSLRARVEQGAFREDLYYRLAVLELAMPPLRARPGDIQLLAAHFLARFTALEKKSFSSISPEAVARLARYNWPGNIRELQNVLHKIVVLMAGAVVTPAMVAGVLPPEEAAAENIISLKPLWQLEKEAIAAALRQCRGNIPQAAALLQVSPSTLYRRRDIADISGV